MLLPFCISFSLIYVKMSPAGADVKTRDGFDRHQQSEIGRHSKGKFLSQNRFGEKFSNSILTDSALFGIKTVKIRDENQHEFTDLVAICVAMWSVTHASCFMQYVDVYSARY